MLEKTNFRKRFCYSENFAVGPVNVMGFKPGSLQQLAVTSFAILADCSHTFLLRSFYS